MRASTRVLILIATLFVLGAAGGALADDLPPGGTFLDDDGTAAEGYIEDITRGCNPPVNDHFCPERALTRGEMATIFVRALDLPATAEHPFSDTADSVHVNSINALAAAGITKGCNPPENDQERLDFRPQPTTTSTTMAIRSSNRRSMRWPLRGSPRDAAATASVLGATSTVPRWQCLLHVHWA